MNNLNIKNIAYIENDIGYIFDDKLSNCGCGGKPISDFYIDNNKFTYVEIHCKKCGISTGECKNEIEAISKWENAFSELNKLKHKIKNNILKESDNTCLGCSRNFDKEEYY